MSNSSASGTGQAAVANQRTLFGHPVGLYVLFFTEMWERFSYYGMRALLVLYMVNFFKWTQEEASGIYKWYTALVYLTPLIGGFLADKYLGNKWAIIIGAILMSIGHFLMAFEELWIFYMALGFLIMGNGFFKPNMSVQVGRLYPQNDPRRDGAYTIFYMGINLGAFLSPIICGALKDTPGLGYHWGFGAAGVGMVLGLLVYVFGLPFIKELPEGAVYHDPDAKAEDEAVGGKDHVMTEDEAATTPSVIPSLASVAPMLFMLMGFLTFFGGPIAAYFDVISVSNGIVLFLAGISAFFASWILSKLSMAVLDRVIAIYILSVFVIFFWGAFEQAGNAMNVWADQTTDRYITGEAPIPNVFPEAPVDLEEVGFGATIKNAFGQLVSLNPVGTTSFQSINALAIVLLAPVFAWFWLFLARRHVKLSIAAKMSFGVFFQGVAFALMMWAVTYENGPSSTSLSALPPGVAVTADGAELEFFDPPSLDIGDKEKLNNFVGGKKGDEPMPAHGGRLAFDKSAGKLDMTGVLDQNHRDRILRATVPADYVAFVYELAIKSHEASEAAKTKAAEEAAASGTSATEEDTRKKEEEAKKKKGDFDLRIPLAEAPDGFEPKYLLGFAKNHLEFDEETSTFVIHKEIADKDYKQILVAGSNPEFRTALNDLYVAAAKYKVSSWWLVWFYIICTIGELCLSPVGLSMVSKLAPRRFATMLMGMWLLTSFFGNFTAGLAGENWERLDPGTYFMWIAIAMLGASLVCFVIAKKVTSMMHGVK